MLEYYIIFCVTTALLGVIELLRPSLQLVHAENPDCVTLDNKLLTYLVFFTAGLLTAPIMFFAVIIPSIKQTTVPSIARGILDSN